MKGLQFTKVKKPGSLVSQPVVLNVVTPPANSLITVADMQSVLRVSDPQERDYVGRLIQGATELVQGQTGKQLLTAVYELSLPCFPACEIEIPLLPLQSIESVRYDDESGSEQVLDDSRYTVQLGSPRRRGSVIPAYGWSWPNVRRHGQAVRVRFVCGFGDSAADVPEVFLQQVRLLVKHWFVNRSAVACGAMTRAELAYDVLQQFNEIKEFV